MFDDPDEIDKDHELEERYEDWLRDKQGEVREALPKFGDRLINALMFAYDQGSDDAIMILEQEAGLDISHVNAWLQNEFAYNDFIDDTTPDLGD